MEKLLRRMDDMSQEERKQLRTLLKEKNKDETQMGWMYRADKPDDEEYLLGRRIDKLEEEPKEEEDTSTPGASFQEVLAKRADLDMQAKMREDPLYAIRKREEDARRRLLENPIKMKQLQKELKKRKKKEKKKKKLEGGDSDDELMAKYMAILKKKGGGDLKEAFKRLEGGDSPESHDKSHDKTKHTKKRSHEDREDGRSSHRQDGDSRDSRYHHGNKDERRPDRRDRRDSSRDRKQKEGTHREDRYGREESRGASSDRSRRDYHRDDRDILNRSDQDRYRSNNRDPRNDYRNDDKNGRTETSSRSDKSRMRHNSSSDSDSDTHRRKVASRNVPRKQQHSRSSSSDSDSDCKGKRQDGNPNRGGLKSAQKRSRHDSSSSSSDEESESGTSDSDADSDESPRKPPQKQFGLIMKGDGKPRAAPQPMKVEPYQKPKVEPRKKSPPRKKLSAAELEKRRQEMMDNASWRNDQRQNNVKRYKEEDEAENASLEKQKHSNSADFINPLMASHASQSSVEDRIKRNRYNVQRSKGDRDGGFTKR